MRSLQSESLDCFLLANTCSGQRSVVPVAGAMNVVVSGHVVEMPVVWNDRWTMVVEVSCVVVIAAMTEVPAVQWRVMANDSWVVERSVADVMSDADSDSSKPESACLGLRGTRNGHERNGEGWNCNAFDESRHFSSLC